MFSLLLSSGVVNNILVEKQNVETVQPSNEEIDSGFGLNDDHCHVPLNLNGFISLLSVIKSKSFHFYHLFSEYFPFTEVVPPEPIA